MVENIHITGIHMTGIKNAAIDFNFFYAARGKSAETPPAPDEGTPTFRNILIEDVISRGSDTPLVMRGLPEMPLRDITLHDVSFVRARR